MMHLTMAVWAKCGCVFDSVFATIAERVVVMHFEIR
jgi:hypothetical protein